MHRLPQALAILSLAAAGCATTRVANIGNRTFAAIALRILLNYSGGEILFWGACA